MTHFKRHVGTLLTPLALLLSAGCAPQQVTVKDTAQQGLVVTGQGEATAPPDVATVRVGVEERAPTAHEAMHTVNARMTSVMEAVKKKGVLPRHLQTTDLNVYFERHPEPYPPVPPLPARSAVSEAGQGKAGAQEKVAVAPSGPAPAPMGQYVVRNTIIISVRNLDQVGEVIGAAMEAGANQLYGFELSIDDPSALEAEARKQAVDQAIEKARALAARAGVALGRVVAIRDLQGMPPMPMVSNRAMALEKAQADVPTEKGQLTVTQSVEVMFELEAK